MNTEMENSPKGQNQQTAVHLETATLYRSGSGTIEIITISAKKLLAAQGIKEPGNEATRCPVVMHKLFHIQISSPDITCRSDA
jgi:hypothetical protein